LSLCTCCRHYPGAAAGRIPRSFSPSRINLPRKGHRVGLHIVLFEDCSAFTRVAAWTLARSPYVVTPYPKASDISSPPCLLRLLPAGAISPGGPRTHWKAPPWHGARRVGMWRGGGRLGMSVFHPFRLAVPQWLDHSSVSTSRSSNRTCGSPASGSRTRPHAFAHDGPRPRRVRRTSPKCP